jgi:aldose 1-epimerase
MTQVDLIRISAGDLSVEIAPNLGGSIMSFTAGAAEIMRSATPASIAGRGARAMASYPMAPFSNRLRDSSLHFAGKHYELVRAVRDGAHALHGNAWMHEWEILAADSRQASIIFSHSGEGEAALEWPFGYEMTQEFSLSPEALQVRLRLRNTASRAAPAGFGLHPFFPRASSARLQFTAATVGAQKADQLPREHMALPVRWNFAKAQPVAGADLDHCFAGWNGPVRIAWGNFPYSVEITADEIFDHLVVYTPNGREEFAVEPVTHDVDAFNRPQPAAERGGMRVLEPGASLTGMVRFAVRRN